MKLKTLKDLQIVPENIEVSLTEGIKAWETTEEYIKNQLKQEAIKWVKELEIIEEKKCESEHCYPEDRCLICDESDEATAKVDWIKYFFNITEEDLKHD